MSPELAVQTALRLRLVASEGVTDLVHVTSIVDSNARPVVDPCILIGEDISRDDGRLSRSVVRVWSTIHIFRKEAGTAGVKAIASAIRDAIHSERLAPLNGWHFADSYVESARFVRDPDNLTAHGIVVVETVAADQEST